MTQFLPPNLLALFAARDPIPYLPPTDKLTHEKKRLPYSGVSDFLDHFEDPEETPVPVKPETKMQKLERKRREKAEQNAYKLEQDLALWNPSSEEVLEKATTDPYKTLFVARINYDTSESKLRREFEAYGKIKSIKLVHDVKTGKPRGYAFIEYEEESAMHAAYKRADGKKIDGKRVIVHVERGRTIKGWKPRRLGGGKGGRKSHLDNGREGRGLSAEDDKQRERDRDRDRDRDRERDRKRPSSRERSRSREKDRERKKRSKSKDRHRSRSKDRAKKSRRSKSKERSSGLNSSSAIKKRSRSREKVRNNGNSHKTATETW